MELFNDFLSWVWARHHNELSWYVRPLFPLPFCYFAYRRSVCGILVTLLVFPKSLLWFPAPGTLVRAWKECVLEAQLAVGPCRAERRHAAQGDLERRVRGAAGWASLAPSLFTLAVTDAAILLAARWLKRRRGRQEVAAQDAERDADLAHPTRATDRSESQT